MKITMTVTNENGKWKVNGKPYKDASDFEKTFLNDFFKDIKNNNDE